MSSTAGATNFRAVFHERGGQAQAELASILAMTPHAASSNVTLHHITHPRSLKGLSLHSNSYNDSMDGLPNVCSGEDVYRDLLQSLIATSPLPRRLLQKRTVQLI